MNKTAYIKSLDGLRFLAVSLVLFDHWSGDALGFPASYLGVCMFFVLSGFLITRILLNAKSKDEDLKRTHGFSLKQFYIRRTIRIFPLYYMVLSILFLLNNPVIRDKIVVLATYMTNNYIAINSQWLGKTDHLWSLAVEEQYYLFFPFILLFIPFKNVKQLLIGMIVLSVAMRAVLYVNGTNWIASYVLMPTCLDAFGLGGLLAYAQYFNKEKLLKLLSSVGGLIFGLALYILTVLYAEHLNEPHNWVTSIFLRFSESTLSVFLIGNLVAPEHVIAKSLEKFFSWQAFVFIGKVSYGIYIFHNFIYNPYHEAVDSYINKVLIKIQLLVPGIWGTQVLKITFLYALTVGIASVSWYVFEKPINKLKTRFGY